MTLRVYDALTGAEVRPGDTIRSLATGRECTFREADRATTDRHDGRIRIVAEPGREYYCAGLFGLNVSDVDDEPEPSDQSEPTAATQENGTMPFTDTQPRTLRAYRKDGTKVLPGEAITDFRGSSAIFWAATRGPDAGRDGKIQVGDAHGPEFYARVFELEVREAGDTRQPEPGTGQPRTLRAYRDDGTEVLPGETITMTGASALPYTFRKATIASNSAGYGGMISVDGSPEMFSRPFGLTVRAAAEPGPSDRSEPAWYSADTGEPGDFQRDIRGPGGFRALIGPASDGRYDWAVTDSSDGAAIARGNVSDMTAAKTDVLAWEQLHGLIPEPAASPDQPVPESSSRPAPSLDAALALADMALAGDPNVTDLEALEKLTNAVHGQLAAGSDASELAAQADEAARTMAPPVPGITRNPHTGHVVYAVLPAGSGMWWVAARNSEGGHVTWLAETCPGGTLAYNGGRYHASGDGTEAEALADLAHRAGIFGKLTILAVGITTREASRESYDRVLGELGGLGIGKARLREGLLEAAALGYCLVSWHTGSQRADYGIHYDRYRCTFSWNREN